MNSRQRRQQRNQARKPQQIRHLHPRNQKESTTPPFTLYTAVAPLFPWSLYLMSQDVNTLTVIASGF
jgi:hypothetical protein